MMCKDRDVPSHHGLKSTVNVPTHAAASEEPVFTNSEYRPTQAFDGQRTDRVAVEGVLSNI